MHIPSPHTPRLAKPSQAKAWLAWYGRVWYDVLAPNHPMRLVEMMGFTQIFLYKFSPQQCNMHRCTSGGGGGGILVPSTFQGFSRAHVTP